MGYVFSGVWFVLTTLLTLLMWGAQVGPDEVASNLSKWAQKAGIQNPPTWLTNKAIDQRVKWFAFLALLALMFVGGIWVGANWAQRIWPTIAFWQPKDGDEVDPLIDVMGSYIVPRDLKTEFPVLGYVGERLATDTKLQHECRYGELKESAATLSPEETEKALQRVVAITNARALETCDPKALPKKSPTYNFWPVPAPGGFLSDAAVKGAQDGTRYLYVFAAWRYRPINSDKIYNQMYCAVFIGDLKQPHFCLGDASRAFLRVGKD